jgi:hypothetical protein
LSLPFSSELRSTFGLAATLDGCFVCFQQNFGYLAGICAYSGPVCLIFFANLG